MRPKQLRAIRDARRSLRHHRSFPRTGGRSGLMTKGWYYLCGHLLLHLGVMNNAEYSSAGTV